MNSWYVAINNGYMVKLFSCKSHMKKLLKNKTIEEYRRCDSRQQADYYCKKYNKVEDFNNETV